MDTVEVHNCSLDVLSCAPLQVNGPGGPLMLLLNKFSGKTTLCVYCGWSGQPNYGHARICMWMKHTYKWFIVEYELSHDYS